MVDGEAELVPYRSSSARSCCTLKPCPSFGRASSAVSKGTVKGMARVLACTRLHPGLSVDAFPSVETPVNLACRVRKRPRSPWTSPFFVF